MVFGIWIPKFERKTLIFNQTFFTLSHEHPRLQLMFFPLHSHIGLGFLIFTWSLHFERISFCLNTCMFLLWRTIKNCSCKKICQYLPPTPIKLIKSNISFQVMLAYLNKFILDINFKILFQFCTSLKILVSSKQPKWNCSRSEPTSPKDSKGPKGGHRDPETLEYLWVMVVPGVLGPVGPWFRD